MWEISPNSTVPIAVSHYNKTIWYACDNSDGLSIPILTSVDPPQGKCLRVVEPLQKQPISSSRTNDEIEDIFASDLAKNSEELHDEQVATREKIATGSYENSGGPNQFGQILGAVAGGVVLNKTGGGGQVRGAGTGGSSSSCDAVFNSFTPRLQQIANSISSGAINACTGERQQLNLNQQALTRARVVCPSSVITHVEQMVQQEIQDLGPRGYCASINVGGSR